MPESSRALPKVAQVEDCESDESSVKPGTAVYAKKRSSHSSKPPKVVQRRAGSDSGYSSHTNASLGAPPVQPVTANTAASRQTAPESPTKSRPTVRRSESQRRPRAPSRSASSSQQCTNPNCDDPTCASKRNPNRRQALSVQTDPAHYAAAYAKYRHEEAQRAQQAQHARMAAQQYPYAQFTQMPSAAPVPATAPVLQTSTARTLPSTRQSRPVSIHGYGNVSYATAPQPHGPPPSPSAYQNIYAGQYAGYQQASIYGSTPPGQIMPAYPTQSPLGPSPTSVSYNAAPGLTRTFSTRTVGNVSGSYEAPKIGMPPPFPRTLSARQTAPMPGAFPGAESDGDSESVSESESDREVGRARQGERQARQLMPPPPARRPSLNQRNTTPAALTRTPREPLQRNPRSDTYVDYPSDYVDSDRTARPVLRPRTNSSHSSRRPSVSNSASSGRTKATTISSGSGAEKQAYIIEDRRGKRREYLSRSQYEDLVRRIEVAHLEDQEAKDREDALRDRAEAYQSQVRGRQPPELTAENIKRATTTTAQRRISSSQISGHSRKTSSSRNGGGGSKGGASGDGIRIQSGDTVLHVYGEAKVEMRPGEDGAYFVIGSSSNASGSQRDSAYHGSTRSSGSRVSRRKDTITEEDGYEKAS